MRLRLGIFNRLRPGRRVRRRKKPYGQEETRMNNRLRVVIADDERPARSFLAAMLRGFDDVALIGEAEDGAEAIELIEKTGPDLALLDLQMPEIGGLGVVRLLKKSRMPLIAFITAYDEYAVRA